MLVLHLIDNLKVGGAQEIILNLIRHRAPGVEHCVASLYGPAEFDREIVAAGGRVVVLAPSRGRFPQAAWRWGRLMRRLKPDVVNLHLEFATLIGLLMQPFCGGARLIVTIHALKAQLPGWFYPVLRLLRRGGDGFVVEDKIALGELHGIGVAPERISHIPIGTDYLEQLKRRTHPPRGVRAEFGIPAAAPLILNVARMHPAKGQDHLLRAFAAVADEIPAARLAIVGYGSEEARLKALAQELGVNERVIFPGLRRDLENFYADADLFVMTALDEGMGVVIYQAMAFGLPVVAYAAGSIGEVVANGASGCLVKVGDIPSLGEAIAKMIGLGGAARSLYGGRGRDLVEQRFSATAMTELYEQFYSKGVS